MHGIDDREELLDRQYASDANLNARVVLHDRYSTGSISWHDWLGARVRLPAGGRVLEVGCGNGLLWTRSRPEIPPGTRLVLSDLSGGMLDAARGALVELPFDAALLRADAQRLPFASGRFDALIANHMLYHVPEPEGALAEMRRVLRPGAQLFMALNGANHMRQVKDWCNTFLADEGGFGPVPITLESVFELFAPGFDVRADPFPDGIRVDAVEPVLAYIRSGISEAAAQSAGFARLGEHLEAELRRRGALEIEKSVALLVATRGPS